MQASTKSNVTVYNEWYCKGAGFRLTWRHAWHLGVTVGRIGLDPDDLSELDGISSEAYLHPQMSHQQISNQSADGLCKYKKIQKFK